MDVGLTDCHPSSWSTAQTLSQSPSETIYGQASPFELEAGCSNLNFCSTSALLRNSAGSAIRPEIFKDTHVLELGFETAGVEDLENNSTAAAVSMEWIVSATSAAGFAT